MMETIQLPMLPLTWQVSQDKLLFVIGKEDAEMDAIVELLRRFDQDYIYATRDGARVTPRNCYTADPITVKEGTTIVLVECEPVRFLGYTGKIRVIDHHRDGDPGFGLPPSQFWIGSSYGQVYNLLKGMFPNMDPPTEMELVIAARDHCRFDAQRGLCPGVDPAQVRELGRKIIARELGVTESKLDGTIKRMSRLIHYTKNKILMGNQEVVDLRFFHAGVIYSLEYLGLYEALADHECAAIVPAKNTTTDGDKVVLMGYLEKSTVDHFMTTWAPQEGLIDIYGCLVRGFAGGYYGHNDLIAAAVA